jgi:(E)-4-hydroxy-3-methylbut-2-enyl-diphosphate synthase
VRINPGNIGRREKVQKLADCLKAHRVSVRVGVNAGSLERELLQKYGGPTAEALAESALSQARMLEDMGVGDIVLSLKASSVHTTVSACRLAAAACDYPLHLGVTEAGTPEAGTVKSAVGIGSLLLDGIGDTIRVSLSGPPENEIPVCLDILRAVGARDGGVEVISCPTCGRTMIDVAGIADRVRRRCGA